MRNVFAALSALLLAFGLVACDPHLDPPARHPDPELDARPGDAPPPRGGPFAEPPPGADGAPREPYESGRNEEYESRAPAPPASAEPSAPEGFGRAQKSAPSRQRSLDEAAPSAAERSSGGGALAPQRRRERPGLATHWGETRYSPAHEVSFERDDPSSPTATGQLYYNDKSGARRLAPRGSWCQGELSLLGGGVRVRMLDASGRPFSALCDGGRVVSQGQPGERYSLAVENRTGQRYEVVATVDGLDVLDGEDGSPDKRGYLIGAYSSVLIDGFRRSEAEVAAFRLGDVSGSYAASKGKARNVGVIGFALFAERQYPVAYYPQYPTRPPRPSPPRPWNDDTSLRESADPFPGRYARPPAW